MHTHPSSQTLTTSDRNTILDVTRNSFVRSGTTFRMGALAGVMGLLSLASSTLAQDFSREGKWSIGLLGQYLMSEDASAEVAGVTADVSLDSVYGGGIAVGYDITDHFTVGLDAWGGTGDIKGSALGTSRKDSIGIMGANTWVDYNILSSRFTPFITANVGLLSMFGDIEGISASETDFLFGAGAGARWDFNDQWFAKATYRANWTEFSGFNELTLVHGFSLIVGYRF